MQSWQPPTSLPDLRRAGVAALDLETRDDRLAADMGSGWPFGAGGYICGVSVAWHEGGAICANYFPLRHPDTNNFDPTQVFQWVRDLIASDVRIVTQNGLYDWGWLRADADIKMPPAERLEEIGALATLIDENRYSYNLNALCAWRGLPGKDETLLHQAVEAQGFGPITKKNKAAAHIWRLPAHFVGPYAEQDAACTLAVYENLNPILDREGTRDAYRLEVALLPMVLEMRRRGVRVNTAAAEQARDLLLRKRDAMLAELSEKLGMNVSMAELGRKKWLTETFDRYEISYPHTAKGNPSFTAGRSGWMHKHAHWLPQLITKAEKYDKAAVDFLEGHILGHVVSGRIHAEIHPHRSDDGGTRSLRFSYSNPPLQQMAARDEEIAPLIRGVFLPEEGQVWAKPDISQQEFRFIVHYAVKFGLQRAQEAADRYRADPNADFHVMVAEMTGLDRSPAKDTNFAKSFGAGPRKFAAMIGKPESEAAAIYERYDRELPFVRQLSKRCEYLAANQGFLELYDDARRHWDQWMPPVAWGKGTLAPCSREEAQRRITDPEHAWYRRGPLRRVDVHKAMNALIQGSAARHTKLWMRAVWREGIVPLLQMHDCLDCSVSSPDQAELVAQLGRDAVKLEVPIQVDLKYGHTWGDAIHTWEELHGAAPAAKPMVLETVSTDADETLAPAPAEPIDDLGSAAPGNGEALDDLLGADDDWPGDGDDVGDDDHRDSVVDLTDTMAIAAGVGGETEIMPAAMADLESDVAAGDDNGLRDSANGDDAEGDGQLGHVGGINAAPGGGHHDHGEAELADATTTMAGVGLVAPIVDFAPAASARPSLRAGNDSRAGGSKIRCPFHDGDDTPSLHVYSDEADPHYHCFGCGAHGPLSDLPEELAAAPGAQTQADDAETLAYAHRLWEQAQSIAGTLAERYLSDTRGIDITALPPDIHEVLRFHAQCPFDGRRPCLLALFRDVATDEPAGIHRIALTPDAKKIERRMLGRWPRPRAIKLWPATNQLYFGEGIETVLGAATRVMHRGAPMRPAWAAGSDGGLGKLPVIPGVERLIVLVDNDLNGAGQTAATRCAERWSRAGRTVIKLTPKRPGADFNDIAKEKAP